MIRLSSLSPLHAVGVLNAYGSAQISLKIACFEKSTFLLISVYFLELEIF